MATLRNKSTNEGVIVLWTPHPEHSRPSTYQVTPDAVGFLAAIGYSVPATGDESEIPWEICRPLRVLGDLYFKSENPGEVNFDGTRKQEDYSLVALSDEQRDALSEYIRQHPNHTNELQNELLVETSTTSENDLQNTNLDTELESGGEELAETESGIIPQKNVHIGKIHRFSGNNNAMIDPISDDAEQNVGEIPKSTEGKWTIHARYGSMGICLTPQLWSDSYRSLIEKNIDELERRIGINSLKDLLRIKQRSYPSKIDHDSTSIYILISGDGYGIGYKGPWTIVVLSDLATHGTEVVVEITDKYGKVLIGKPTTKPISSNMYVGDEIIVDVVKVDSNKIIGSYQSNYVEIPRTSASPSSRLKVSVTNIRSNCIHGTVSSLSKESVPRPGDEITLISGKASKYPHLPVIIPDSLPATAKKLQLGVAEVVTDGIRVSVVSRGGHPPVVQGQVLTETFTRVDSGPYLSIQNGFPIQIEGVRHIPGYPIEFKIDKFNGGFVTGIFTGASTIESVIGEYDEHIESGVDYFAQGQIKHATEQFIHATEVANTAEEIRIAQFLEIYGLSRKLLEETDVDEAIHFCRARLKLWSQESELEANPFRGDVQAIESALCALNSAIKLERTDDRKQQTTLRNEIQDKLCAAVDELSDSACRSVSYDFEPLLSWINNIIIESSDHLIIVPDSVGEYIENAHTVSSITTGRQNSGSEKQSPSEDHDQIPEDTNKAFGDRKELDSQTGVSNDSSAETQESHTSDPSPSNSKSESTYTDPATQNLVEAWESAIEAGTSGETEIVVSAQQSSYSRSKAVQKFARLRADGHCEYCGKKADFVSKTGELYLEVHHIDELSDGGADHPNRVAALCPTCHSEIHYGEYGDLLNARVDKILSMHLADIGRSTE